MATTYPTALDSIALPVFTGGPPTAALGQAGRTAESLITDLRDAIEAIQAALGTTTDPGPLFNSVASGGALNVKSPQFGAVGDRATDDSAAFLSCISAAIMFGADVYAPAGKYLLNSAAAAAINSAKFALRGAGPGLTEFVVPAGNTAGGLLFDITDSARDAEIAFSDFTITTQGVGQGTGLRVAAAPGDAQHQRSVRVEHVLIRGENLDTDCFDIGVDLTGCERPYVEDVIITGPWGPTISGRTDDANPQYVATAGLVLDACYEPYVNACHIWGADRLIRSIGTTEEAGRITNCQLVAGKTGIEWRRSGQEPHLQIEGNHINCRDAALDVDGCRILFATGNHFYNTDDEQNFTGQPRDIWLRNIDVSILGSNVFHFDGHPNRINVDLDLAVDTFGNSGIQKILVSGNIFNANCKNAVRVGAGASTVTITDNLYTGTFVKRVDDQSGTAAIFDTIAGSFRLTSQNAGSAVGPSLKIKRDSASPAANDFIGEVEFSGNNSTGAEKAYVSVGGAITDPTAGVESSTLQIWTMVGGVATKVASFNPVMASNSTGQFLLTNIGGVVSLQRVMLGTPDASGRYPLVVGP